MKQFKKIEAIIRNEKENETMKKTNKKKLNGIMGAVLACSLCAMTALSAFAAGTPATPDGDGKISISGTDEVTIAVDGKAEATAISGVVTLNTYFAIDANQPEGNQFTSPNIAFENTSNAPLTVSGVELKATGEAPKVVAHDKYTDEEWAQLDAASTKSNIALGLTDGSTGKVSMWFAEESAQAETKICDVPYQATQNLKLQAKFGRTWGQSESFKYHMVIKLALKAN